MILLPSIVIAADAANLAENVSMLVPIVSMPMGIRSRKTAGVLVPDEGAVCPQGHQATIAPILGACFPRINERTEITRSHCQIGGAST
jgi:hypothetical protein